jgi:MFS family permease
VGIVEGAAETTASFVKVVSGYWSDKLQRRKPFILFGYSLSAVTKPLFALANIWGLVLFIRVIERIGKGLRTAPRDALVAESCDECFKGKAFGFHRAMDGIGSILGALLAFALLPALGYRNIFLFAAVPGLIAVMVIHFVREKPRAKPVEASQSRSSLSFKALPANLRLLILVCSIFALGHFGYAFLLLKALDVGLADNSAILLYVLFYTIYTICAMPLGTLSDRVGREPILIGGYLLFAVISLGLAISTSVPMVALWFGVYGIAFAAIDGTQRAFVADLAPEHLRATALGTFHTAISLTALPGGFIAGFLWDRISPEATFIFGFCLALFATLMLVFINDRRQNRLN